MSIFGRYLSTTIAAAAMMASQIGTAFIRAADLGRPTPRKPERRKYRAVASAHRSEMREDAKKKFERQLRKEKAIGVDPIHWHGSSLRKDARRPDWLKQSKEWDRVNG